MARSNVVETSKLQVTVDATTDRLIDELARIGIHGTSKAEVACSILRMWLWDNQEKLMQNGVFVAPENAPRPRAIANKR